MTPTAAGRLAGVSGASGASAADMVCDEAFDAASLHLLRGLVAACATAAGLSEDRATLAILAVHELAANSVRHGAGSGRLLMYATGDGLRCQVSDDQPGTGRTWPVRQGHGLWIVASAADEVAVQSGPGGSLVTVTFATHPEQDRHQIGRDRA
jgi:anti-sigma regulatory factor (Ser/Thr protein kinase)